MTASDRPNPPRRIAVVGGGISGLAAAHRLVELDASLDVTLLEATDRLGGVVQTVCRDGFLIERSADNFITYMPWAVGLCRRIGMADELVRTDDRFRKAFVVHRGRLRDIPEGFVLMTPNKPWPVLTTPILSLRAKLRLGWEYFVPARTDPGDESIASFVTRRLGRETYERIVQPLVGGIYTGDPEKLSIAATMPQFVEMERKYGGLIRGAKRQAAERKKREAAADRDSSGARYSLFVTPRRGLTSMIEAIAARLPQGSVRLDSPVQRLSRREDGRWALTIGPSAEPETFDAVILAMPAYRAARLLGDIDEVLAGDLDRIPYTGTTVVSVGYRREQIEHPLDGFGFVVPRIEGRRVLAGSFSSVKYPGRAPEGMVLMRVFVGGAVQEELAQLPEDDLKILVREEFAELLGARGEPLLWEISRWKGTMAQYQVGHVELVAGIQRRAARIANLELAGNAYHGVGMPQCIHSGEQAAEQVAGQKD